MEVLATSPGYIDDSEGKRLVYDLRVARNRGLTSPIWGYHGLPAFAGPTGTQILAPPDFFSINWYPRLTSKSAQVKLLLPQIVPIGSTELTEYVENNIGRITYENAQEAANILGLDVIAMLAVGVNINLFSITYEILAVSLRYYRNRPLFFELNLKATLFRSATTVPTDPANGTPVPAPDPDSATSVTVWADANPKVRPPKSFRNQPYSFDYRHYRLAVNTRGNAIRYSASNLPVGLIMSSNGVISGSPTGSIPSGGAQIVTVTASSTGALDVTDDFWLAYEKTAPIITWAQASAADVGTATWFERGAFVVIYRESNLSPPFQAVAIKLGPLTNTDDWPAAARTTANAQAPIVAHQLKPEVDVLRWTKDTSASPVIGLLAKSPGFASRRVDGVRLLEAPVNGIFPEYGDDQQFILLFKGSRYTHRRWRPCC